MVDEEVIYQNLSKRQGMKQVWLEGPAGHRVVVFISETTKVLSGRQAYSVKLFIERDFWRELFYKKNNWVVANIFEAAIGLSWGLSYMMEKVIYKRGFWLGLFCKMNNLRLLLYIMGNWGVFSHSKNILVVIHQRMGLIDILKMQRNLKQQGQVVVSFNLVEEDLMVKQLNLEHKLLQQLIMLLVGVIVRVTKLYMLVSFYCLGLVNERSRVGSRCTRRAR